ncbi:2052_t:CDS:2 [Ambispora gerdemannii]|uniref:2052_t:CDS:1 n=1 Tax=Ambispora gerdemannii TaxID=144530 RepID=A0A9N9C6L4_9GLOM|nr:2052_t:CDS:2 [Ambispora gerdemannii]
MIKGAMRSLSNTGGSIRRNVSNASRRTQKSAPVKLSTEMTHLIVKRCADEIEERGLHEVDIFKPVRIGENADEVKDLINRMLQDNRMQFEDEIKSQNIHNVVAAMKWALRHCEVTLVPYMFYEEFVRFEQEWDFDPEKGSFSQFLLYLPKQNQEILLCLFDICAKVTEESHINQMSAQKIVKSLALCVLGEQERKFDTFDDAYSEYSKCSNACLHLFLAYLREKAVATRLPPRLTLFLDNINYLDVRKKSVASMYIHPQTFLNRQTYMSTDQDEEGAVNDYQYTESYLSQTNEESDYEEGSILSPPPSTNNYAASTTSTSTITKNTFPKQSLSTPSTFNERPASVLRVTRTIPVQQPGQTQNINPRASKGVSILLPEIVNDLNRQTLVRASALMTVDEQKTAQTLWKEFQTEGVSGFSDEFIKLFFSLDDRDELYETGSQLSPTSPSFPSPLTSPSSSAEKQKNNRRCRSNKENGYRSQLRRSQSELDKYKPKRGPRPITLVWNNFREFGFDGLVGGIGNKKDPKVEQLLGYNDSSRLEQLEEIQDNDSGNEQRPITMAWNSFKENGFGDIASDNMSDAFSLNNTTINSPPPSIFSNDVHSPSVAPSIAPSVFSNDANASVLTHKSRKTMRSGTSSGKSFSFRRRQMPQSDEGKPLSTASRTVEEEIQKWHIIDRKTDLPSTTHLAIETIDEIFPYVWMESTAENKDGYWGDWVFIEPRKGLLNECEWIMIENQQHVFGNDWGNPNNYRQFSKRRSKLGFSWIRRSFVGKRSSQANYQTKVKRFNTTQATSRNNTSKFSSRYSRRSSKSTKSSKSKKKGKKVEGLPPGSYARNGKLYPNAASETYSRNDVKLMPNENNGRDLNHYETELNIDKIIKDIRQPLQHTDKEEYISTETSHILQEDSNTTIETNQEISQEDSNTTNETNQEISQEQDQQLVEPPKKESAPIYKLSQNATPKLIQGKQNDKTQLKPQGSQRYKYIDIPKMKTTDLSNEAKNKAQPYPTANNNVPSEAMVSTQQQQQQTPIKNQQIRPQVSRSNTQLQTETKFSRSNEKIQASNSQENIPQPLPNLNKELPMKPQIISEQISAQQPPPPHIQSEMLQPSVQLQRQASRSNERIQPQRQASKSNEQIQPERIQPQRQASISNEQIQHERKASRRQPYPQASNARPQQSSSLTKEFPLAPQVSRSNERIEQIQSQKQASRSNERIDQTYQKQTSRSNERIQPETQASRSNEQILLQREVQPEVQESRLNERVQPQRQASRSNERIQPQKQASSSQERIKNLPSSSSDSISQSQNGQNPLQQQQPPPIIQNEKSRPYGNDEKLQSYPTDAKLQPYTNDVKLQPYANDTKLQPFPNNAKIQPYPNNANNAKLQPYPNNAHVAEGTYATDDILNAYARSERSGTLSDAGSIYSNDQRNNINTPTTSSLKDNSQQTPKKYQGYQTTSQRLAAQTAEKASKHTSVSSNGSTAPTKPARSNLRTKFIG